MNRKQKASIVSAILYLFIASCFLVFPWIKQINVNILFVIVMGFYIVVNLGTLLYIKEKHDIENILSAIVCLFMGIVAWVFRLHKTPSMIALFLFGFVALESFVKLKKADYYHDHKSNMWIVEVSFLIIFILAGLLTCVNLNYSNEVQTLLLGTFFFIYGILELADSMMIYLTKGKKQSESRK